MTSLPAPPPPGTTFLSCRYKQTWRTGGQRGAKQEGEAQHVLVPLGPPSPPLSETPLLSPPGPLAPGALHVTNLDYFFSEQ